MLDQLFFRSEKKEEKKTRMSVQLQLSVVSSLLQQRGRRKDKRGRREKKKYKVA